MAGTKEHADEISWDDLTPGDWAALDRANDEVGKLVRGGSIAVRNEDGETLNQTVATHAGSASGVTDTRGFGVLFSPGDLAALGELDLDLGLIMSTPTADDAFAAGVRNYDPDQPREPAGTPGGGQFARDPGKRTGGKSGDETSSRLDDSRDLVHSYIRENGPATDSELGYHLVDEGHSPDHSSAISLVHDLHAAGHLKRGTDEYGRETYDAATPGVPGQGHDAHATRDALHGYIRENGPATADELHYVLTDALDMHEAEARATVQALHESGALKQGLDKYNRLTFDVGTGTPEKAPDAHAALKPVADAAASHANPEVRARMGEAVSLISSRLTEESARLIALNVESAHVYETVLEAGAGVKQQLAGLAGAESFEGGNMGGAYVGDGKRGLHIVSGYLGLTGSEEGRLRTGGEHADAHILAHELGHAIDGPGSEFSKQKDWVSAWIREVGAGKGALRFGTGWLGKLAGPKGTPLTEYAKSSPAEGFAEFSRLLHASDVPQAEVEKTFPKCLAFWKENGLWAYSDSGPTGNYGPEWDQDEVSPPVTNADLAGGHWLTIHGSHVYIKDGNIVAGPGARKAMPTDFKALHAKATRKSDGATKASTKAESTGTLQDHAKALALHADTAHLYGLLAAHPENKYASASKFAADYSSKKATEHAAILGHKPGSPVVTGLKPVSTTPSVHTPDDSGAAGHLLSREQIRAMAHPGEGHKELKQRLADHLATVNNPSGPVNEHGMAVPEEMHHVKVDGVDVHFPQTDSGRRAAAGTLVEAAGAGLNKNPLHPTLWSAQHRIIFTDQASKYDKKEAQHDRGQAMAATAGDGQIVVYQGAIGAGVLSHEAGHNLATKVWGGLEPLRHHEHGDYAKAQQVEDSLSLYASRSRNPEAEDFAEAMRLHSTDPIFFKVNFPAKYAAARKLLKDYKG